MICHTCGGAGFYWIDDPEKEFGRYPKRCNDCLAFAGLNASQRMTITRTHNDIARRIERRESKKNPRWFDQR